MDAAQWPQGLGLVKPMEDLVSTTTTTLMASTLTSNNTTNTYTTTRPQMMTEKRARPQKEQALNCPRCNSTNTKFCYYNNYSLTQPRYFCKTCRRYWTEGGTLRNVPVGGGSRKNKRHPSSSSAAAAASASTSTSSMSSATNINSTVTTSSSSKKLHAEHIMPPQDLNLAFNYPSIGQLNEINSTSSNPSGGLSAMELLRSEMAGRSIGSFVPMQMQMPMQEYNQQHIAFGMQEFRPPAALGFPLDGVGDASNYGNLHGVQERSNNGRLLFPFEQLKPVAPSSDGAAHFEQNRGQAHDQDPPGFWQGMIGGGEGSW